MHRQHRAVSAPAIALVVVLLAACSAGTPAATPSPTAVPASSLECEDAAYPCAFVDVPDSVRVETERLVSEATDRIADGATNDELVAWLDAEPLVEEVEGDADSVRFRPTGGRAVWITRRRESAPVPTALTAGAVALSGTMEAVGSRSGIHASVTGPGRPQRNALVLSPYRWDFGDSDDGEGVAERLRQLPDYAGSVTYAENAKADATDVTVDDFTGWDEQQVVHVVSHGARLCIANKCRAFVAAHALLGGMADLFGSTTRGLDLEVEIGPTTPRLNVLLGADFFRDQYPAGLPDSVVFLNGCSTFGPGASDLADAIRGTGGVVLGWSRPVGSTAAYAASLGLYEELAGNGRPVGDALEHIGDLATDASLFGSTLSTTGRALGGDLRIRDVVDFESTQSGEPLAAEATVPLVGEPGDGVPDSVLWRLQVDGIDPAAAATAVVQVTIDGHAAAPVTVATGAAEANDSWELSATLPLGVDISTPHPALFQVTLALPDGGTSVDSVSAVLVGESVPTPGLEAPMGTTWSGLATNRQEVPFEGVSTVAEAELIFTLNRRNPDLPIYAYELTGGTMTYSVNGTRPDGCTYDLSPTEFSITPDMAESAGEFVIDARNSPPTFYGFVHVTGPIVEVMQTCPDPYAYLTGPYSTGANAIFMEVAPDEGRTVEGDRISGTSGAATFDFHRAE